MVSKPVTREQINQAAEEGRRIGDHASKQVSKAMSRLRGHPVRIIWENRPGKRNLRDPRIIATLYSGKYVGIIEDKGYFGGEVASVQLYDQTGKPVCKGYIPKRNLRRGRIPLKVGAQFMCSFDDTKLSGRELELNKILSEYAEIRPINFVDILRELSKLETLIQRNTRRSQVA